MGSDQESSVRLAQTWRNAARGRSEWPIPFPKAIVGSLLITPLPPRRDAEEKAGESHSAPKHEIPAGLPVGAVEVSNPTKPKETSPNAPRASVDDRVFEAGLLKLMPLIAVCARKLTGGKDGSEDLAQETFLKAWQARATYVPGTNLKAWLFTIMRNHFYGECRRAWRKVDWDDKFTEKMNSDGADQEFAIDLADVQRALSGIQGIYRDALLLVGPGQLTYEEAVPLCRCPMGTVKSRVSRARVAVKKALAENHDVSLPTRSNINSAEEIIGQVEKLMAAKPV